MKFPHCFKCNPLGLTCNVFSRSYIISVCIFFTQKSSERSVFVLFLGRWGLVWVFLYCSVFCACGGGALVLTFNCLALWSECYFNISALCKLLMFSCVLMYGLLWVCCMYSGRKYFPYHQSIVSICVRDTYWLIMLFGSYHILGRSRFQESLMLLCQATLDSGQH